MVVDFDSIHTKIVNTCYDLLENNKKWIKLFEKIMFSVSNPMINKFLINWGWVNPVMSTWILAINQVIN